MDTMKILGNRIQIIRTAKQLTQEELAYRIEKSPHFISDIERGIRKPNIITLIDLIKGLDSTPAEFFCDVIPSQNPIVTDALKIFTELPDEHRLFLFNIILGYKKLFDTANNKKQ